MIFVVAGILAVAGAFAFGRGERVWTALLLLAIVPTVGTAFGFVGALAVLIAYLGRSFGSRRAPVA
ncbi:MAG: hypothetical protein JJE52_17475 [Acidimicrobiia bacterium]|nr:hypothetical protein [Acidimicrobiia bacterium]